MVALALLHYQDSSVTAALLGEDADGQPVAYDVVRDEASLGWSPDQICAVLSVDPSAVFFGLQVERAHAPLRIAANRSRRYQPRGQLFGMLPEGEMSGFPVAESVLRRHRMETPSEDTVRVCALFAVNTVRVTIAEAEKQFACFGSLYRASGREMPPIEVVRRCFSGLQNTKSHVFTEVAAYAPVIRDAISHGYRDRELRHVLAMDSSPPSGLGLAKLSFVLALLGQDTVCIDGRLLGRMFKSPKDRIHFEKVISKREGAYSQKAVDAYEALEDAFLEQNPYYDPSDPIGRARAQWMSWESVGGFGSTHQTWFDLL